MSMSNHDTTPLDAREPMRLRNALALTAMLLIVALAVIAVAILNARPPAAVPAVTGNYVFIAQGRCELHLVRVDPAQSLVIRPQACEPLLPGSPLASSVVAATEECGELVFGPPATSKVQSDYSCAPCNALEILPPTCPFTRYAPGALLYWTRID